MGCIFEGWTVFVQVTLVCYLARRMEHGREAGVARQPDRLLAGPDNRKGN